MQPHWIEPAPLGDAQRVGMHPGQQQQPQQAPNLLAPRDPRSVHQQVRREHARLSRHRGGALGGFGNLTTGGILGVGVLFLGAGAAGYFLGRKHGSSLAAENLKEALENPGGADDELEALDLSDVEEVDEE